MSDWAEVCRHALQFGAGLWVQSTVLLSVGLAAGWLMRKWGPLFEVAACKALFCAVLLSTLLTVALAGHIRPIWRIDLPAIQPAPSAAAYASGPGAETTIKAEAPTATSPPQTNVFGSHSPVTSGQSVGFSWSTIYVGVAALWLVISLVQIAWFLPGTIALARISRMPTVAEVELASIMLEELSRQTGISAPRLIVHDDIGSPFVAGVKRPMIVLPASMLELDEPVLRAVLSHELGHVASNDNTWAPLFRIVTALAWPQPLLRVLYLRWLSASEYACDARALSNGCSPMVYAECLVRLSEERQSLRGVHVLALGAAPFRSLLGRRVQQILTWRGGDMHTLSLNASCALGSAAVLAGFAAVFLVPGSVGARATMDQPYSLASPQFPSLPAAPAKHTSSVNHDATTKKGVPMNRSASRMLSTAAVIAAGLTQANLPAAAAPAALPVVHIGQPAPLKANTDSAAAVQGSRTVAAPLITLRCDNAPTRTAFEKIFQMAGVSYSISSEVSGSVTFDMLSLPLDAALRVILQSSDQPLTYEVVDNVYVIKTRAKLQTVPQATPPPTSAPGVSPASAATNGSSDPSVADSTERHWFKVILQHTKSKDVYDQLSQDEIAYPGVIPSDVQINVLQADNSLLINATKEEFANLKGRIGTLDAPAQ